MAVPFQPPPACPQRVRTLRRRALPRLSRVPLAVLLPTALLLGLGGCSLFGGGWSGTPPVQRLSRYDVLLAKPLSDRVQVADDAVLDREHRTNRKYGDDVRPRAADPGDPLAGVVRRVLAELPPPVARLAAAHLAAVYLVQDDVATATTEGVQDAFGRWNHAYIVLNLTALKRNANAWATWKERSAFRPSPGYALAMTIEPPASDDRAGAVRFILLHELGHVLGLGLGVHGYWDDPRPVPPATRDSPFVALSWVVQPAQGKAPEALRSRYAKRYPLLSQVAFYRFDRAPLALSAAPQVYDALQQTNFPSLYGTEEVFDDFAESFAIYVHTVLLGRPYRVQVLHKGIPVVTYRSCITTGGCPRKTALVAKLLGGPPATSAAQRTAGARVDGPPRG